MSSAKVQSLAASVVATVATITSIILPKSLLPETVPGKVLVFIVGVAGFYVFFQMTMAIGAWLRYRKFLGGWTYVSWREDAPEGPSYAFMKFGLTDAGELKYKVWTYSNAADAMNAARRKKAIASGDANSLTCTYQEHDESIDMIYQFNLSGGEPRRGLIHIVPHPGARLVGRWVSVVREPDQPFGKANQGVWRASRAKDFPALLQELKIEADHPESIAAHLPLGTAVPAPATR